MCIPCGPRSCGRGGRVAYTWLDDLRSPDIRDNALKAYPDNDAALEEIKTFISNHIAQTEKWLVNMLVETELYLAYIWAEPENRTVLHKFYLAERRKYTNS